MSPEEVVAFLRGEGRTNEEGPPALAFDTNTIFGDNPRSDPGIEVINTVNRANAARGEAPPVRLVVPAVVFHEKVRQMIQRRGGKFDASLPLGFVRSNNLEIEPFEQQHALAVAKRLHGIYPTRGDWRAFKKRRCLQCLKLSAATATGGDGHDCGATVDWLIVGHAEAMGYLLVTNDGGPEFVGVALRANLDTVLAAAKALLASRGPAETRRRLDTRTDGGVESAAMQLRPG
ncbi:MAG: hypothetical protein U0324_12285 [Polyangiales bacterium]